MLSPLAYWLRGSRFPNVSFSLSSSPGGLSLRGIPSIARQRFLLAEKRQDPRRQERGGDPQRYFRSAAPKILARAVPSAKRETASRACNCARSGFRHYGTGRSRSSLGCQSMRSWLFVILMVFIVYMLL